MNRNMKEKLAYAGAGAVFLLIIPVLTVLVLKWWAATDQMMSAYTTLMYGGLFILPTVACAVIALLYALRQGGLCLPLLIEGVLWQIPVWYGTWPFLFDQESLLIKLKLLGRYCWPLLGVILLLGLLGIWAKGNKCREPLVWLGFWSAGLLLTIQTALSMVVLEQAWLRYVLALIPAALLLYELLHKKKALPAEGFGMLAALLVVSVVLSLTGSFMAYRLENLLFVLLGFVIVFAGEGIIALRSRQPAV